MTAYAASPQLQPSPRPAPQTSAASLLAELEAVHSILLERIAELGQVAERPAHSRLECTSARLRLSQASIERRATLQRVVAFLVGRVDDSGAHALARVRAADSELIAHSVAHLAKWTAEAVAADWPGYREASRSMREHMARTVKIEAEILRPLLAR